MEDQGEKCAREGVAEPRVIDAAEVEEIAAVDARVALANLPTDVLAFIYARCPQFPRGSIERLDIYVRALTVNPDTLPLPAGTYTHDSQSGEGGPASHWIDIYGQTPGVSVCFRVAPRAVATEAA